MNKPFLQILPIKVWAPLIVTAIWLLPTLLDNRLGFRDISHFYLPLYEYLSERAAEPSATFVPLWNPLLLTGAPVIGDNTSALFYPGRWLFLLPISTEIGITLYVFGHLLLAGFAANYAARRAGVSGPYAGLAAVNYALSAPVVQQYCNLPFLVGAAWLPIALSGLLQCITIGSRRAIAVAALGLSMPILGGDPQTTLHVVLIAGGYWCFAKLRNILLMRKRELTPDNLDESAPIKARTLPLILAGSLAFAASLIQILPTWHWSRQSERHSSNDSKVFLDQVYEFSTGPWNAIELMLPNLYGPTRPINGRWSRLLNDHERFWTTSIYCGLIALPALLGLMRRRRLEF